MGKFAWIRILENLYNSIQELLRCVCSLDIHSEARLCRPVYSSKVEISPEVYLAVCYKYFLQLNTDLKKNSNKCFSIHIYKSLWGSLNDSDCWAQMCVLVMKCQLPVTQLWLSWSPALCFLFQPWEFLLSIVKRAFGEEFVWQKVFLLSGFKMC